MPPRIVIAGAGLAGLGAAWRLARAGAEPVVLERARRPGGRLAGERREGFCLEPGAQVLSTGDRRLRRLLGELGMEDAWLPLRSTAAGELRDGWVHEREPGPPRFRGRDAWRLLRLPRLLGRYRPNLDPRAPERAAPHDDRSAADFGRLYFGERVLERWIAPEIECDALGDAEADSRVLWLLRRVGRRGAPALLRPGLGALSEALAARLDVRFGAEVTRVEADAPGGALVSFHEDGTLGTIGADAVVLALPAPAAARTAGPLLVDAERRFFAAARSAPAVTLLAALGDPIVPRMIRVRIPSREGGPLASLTLEPGRPGGRVPDGACLARLVARPGWSAEHLDAPDETIAKELLRPLFRLHPVAAERLRFQVVTRYPEALPRFPVGRYRALARFAAVQADRRALGRRLYFAGDWRIGPTAESALVSGERAAEAVLADLAR